MILIKHEEQPWEQWRPGVVSRAWATAATGALQVRIAEQVFDPGTQAPQHWHYFEENITVVSGTAEFTIDGETAVAGPGTTVIAHALSRHGFRNVGDGQLRVIASMSWPINEMMYDGERPGMAWRAGEVINGGVRRQVDSVDAAALTRT